MNLFLWIVAGILAVAFLAAGVTKLFKPREELYEAMPWTRGASDSEVKLVGLVELLGAIGLILPAAVDVAPILVPIAAGGLAITMVAAIAVHIKADDPPGAAMPAAALGLMAVVVAIGRIGPAAF